MLRPQELLTAIIVNRLYERNLVLRLTTQKIDFRLQSIPIVIMYLIEIVNTIYYFEKISLL